MQTHVNGELRQNATTDDLIFSIPYLLKTMSEGQTLMPGDVLATGTVRYTRGTMFNSQTDTDCNQSSPPESVLVATHRSTSILAMRSSSRYLDSVA